MKIEHIALWSNDIEGLKNFYIKYFNAKPGELYENKDNGFQSYFLSFSSGCRLEIMQKTGTAKHTQKRTDFRGYAHIAASVGEMQDVVELTKRLETDGYEIIKGPRYTGDGYFESVVLDPDGNMLEITTD